jgi:hypothetical protein
VATGAIGVTITSSRRNASRDFLLDQGGLHFRLAHRANESYPLTLSGVQWKHALKESYGFLDHWSVSPKLSSRPSFFAIPFAKSLFDEARFGEPMALLEPTKRNPIRGHHEA